MANDPIPQRLPSGCGTSPHLLRIPPLRIDRDPLPRRIEKLRALYEKSKAKDIVLATREMYKHIERYYTLELFELLNELARDNLFFIEQLPDFPIRSLTSFEVRELDTDLQGLTLRLTNEDQDKGVFSSRHRAGSRASCFHRARRHAKPIHHTALLSMRYPCTDRVSVATFPQRLRTR